MEAVLEKQGMESGGTPMIEAPPVDRDRGALRRGPSPRKVVLGLLLVAGMAIGGYYGVRALLYAQAHESTDDAFIEAHVSQVSPRVAGHVVQVLVDDNQRVTKGQLLLEIDPSDYQTRLGQAQAAYDVALARQRAAEINVDLTRKTTDAVIEKARAGVDEAKSAIESAQAQAAAALSAVKAADADAIRADADLKRYQTLDRSVVSPQTLDAATAAAMSASAQLDAARTRAAAAAAAVIEARAKLAEEQAKLAEANTAPQQVAAAEANLLTATADSSRAKAALDQAKLDLSYTKVYSPIDGRVARKSVEPGNHVQVGQAVMALVEPHVWVVANFKETQLRDMRPGQAATVELDAYPGRPLRAHVDSIQSGSGARFSLLPPENATGNYVKVVQRVPVKIVFDEPLDADRTMAPGMSVVPEVKVK